MTQPSLAIFSNFFIDNEERLQRMKDSFFSFKDINPKEWVINIRGSLKLEAGNFLKKELGENLNLFYLQSKQGWMYDSLIISKKINSDYVFYWIEDNILISSPIDLKNCIMEMKEFDVEHFLYTFFLDEKRNNFDLIEPYKLGKYIKVYKLDLKNCSKIRKLAGEFYTVSSPSIMQKDFFIKILLSPKPYLKRWHRNLPFDFEKVSNDNIFPVVWYSLPNKEQFVVIDDNASQPGYSLISRGLYPNRISRYNMKILEFGHLYKISEKIKKLIPIKIRPFFLWPFKFLRSLFYTLNFLINNR
tara:strand:+ start:251 stop:1153 length:903 start_codon:yes stop_codon:yes gene_type:complete